MKQTQQCEYCKQEYAKDALFLCKGKMACNGCFRERTKYDPYDKQDPGNTIFIDENKYRRNHENSY